jgi:hypothetical protein
MTHRVGIRKLRFGFTLCANIDRDVTPRLWSPKLGPANASSVEEARSSLPQQQEQDQNALICDLCCLASLRIGTLDLQQAKDLDAVAPDRECRKRRGSESWHAPKSRVR